MSNSTHKNCKNCFNCKYANNGNAWEKCTMKCSYKYQMRLQDINCELEILKKENQKLKREVKMLNAVNRNLDLMMQDLIGIDHAIMTNRGE